MKAMRPFVRRNSHVSAVQWMKHGDHPDVKKYAQGTIDHMPAYAKCGYIMELDLNGGHVKPGDWIVRELDGSLRVYTDREFHSEFMSAEI